MRFGFGKNWKSYKNKLTHEMLEDSKASITKSLNRSDFTSIRILDIGSGSGLSSLAFIEMGAEVTAFDFDIDSVECTLSLLTERAPDTAKWRALQGSVLDVEFMRSLGTFDIVYSWGVLHHTGAMWQAMNNASSSVKDGGTILVALYNDQGLFSKFWKAIKWTYCSSAIGKPAIKSVFYPIFFAYSLFQDAVNRKAPLSYFKNYYQSRGMSIVHDWDDWLGGYPFEVASASAVAAWAVKNDLSMRTTRATKGFGCNEFVFHKD